MTGNIHIGLAALGAAIGVGMIGMKASEAVGRNPGAATPILVQAILSTAFAEGIVFFAIYLAHGQVICRARGRSTRVRALPAFSLYESAPFSRSVRNGAYGLRQGHW